MAWNYARYIQAVTEAGKRIYALPMYVNAQLPAPAERAGEYPSGGPHPHFLAVYRAAAPAIDFYSPDIYWPNFEYWVQLYKSPDNPIFIRETRIESAAIDALYAYGEAHAFGFCPFDIDSLQSNTHNGIPDTYATLSSISHMLLEAQHTRITRAPVLHANSPRPIQPIALGGYLFKAELSRSWPSKVLQTDDGGVILLQTSVTEFLVIGSGVTIDVDRDARVDDQTAGISSIAEVTRTNGKWTTIRRLNGTKATRVASSPWKLREPASTSSSYTPHRATSLRFTAVT